MESGSVLRKAIGARMESRFTQNLRHNRPIGAHFHSGGAKFSYFGEDFDEAFG
jgi:hypothetical protein